MSLGNASSETAILAVGTFQTNPSNPVKGTMTVINGDGISGTYYSTITVLDTDKYATATNPLPIQMGNNTITKDAVSVHLGTTAYILDKVVY